VAISRITGRSYRGFKSGKSDHTWEYVQELYERFVSKYGAPDGGSVQENIFGRSFNLYNPEDRKEFLIAGAHVDKCPSVCGDVVICSVEIILEIQKNKTEAIE